MTEILTTPDINEAWDRIARTSDGQIIYRHLMRLVMAPAPDDGALPRHEGARTLARSLMDLMADGIADNDRYCVAFPRAKPAATERSSRRVTLDDTERVGNTELDKSLAAALAASIIERGTTGNGSGGAA